MSFTDSAAEIVPLSVTVNGVRYEREVPARMLLIHFLREELDLTGSKIGCETSACGCCTVLLDGRSVKSCTVLAAQAHLRQVVTIEGLANGGELSAVQRSFTQNHALQCGYCTAGMVMSAVNLLAENPHPTRDQIKMGIAGNLCRCTGYRFVVDAVEAAAAQLSAEGERPA